jgi:hypothetical protein
MSSQRVNFVISILFIFFSTLYVQELELFQTFDPGLPPSGRNSSLLGEVVSNIGDVNGDGYSDWAFGLQQAADIITSKMVGKVYIYFGSPSPVSDQNPDLILKGETDKSFFGWSVSSAGDVNSDGYDDLIVGAYADNEYTGRAYIYYGGLSMDDIADVIFTGEIEYGYFGYSLSSIGDVNGDNFDDIIVGAPYAGEETEGKSYIFYGGLSMDNIADVILTGETEGDSFGRSVSSGGNINGDDYDDVIIGAFTNDVGGNRAGRAYIYYGSSSMDNTADVIFTAEGENDYFGNSVSSAGDVNMDGYADIIVGAFRYSGGGLYELGRAYVYYGGISMDNVADVILTGESDSRSFGRNVSSAGDVNNDGYADVIVSSDYVGGTTTGRVYIFYGESQMDTLADVVLVAESSGDCFGYGLSSAGDINNDGYDDVIIGAYANATDGECTGKAYIYYGSSSMDNDADVVFTGEIGDYFFGWSVSSAGDVNGDGYDDVIVGAYRDCLYQTRAGQAYLYFGGSSMSNGADIIFTGENGGDYFGIIISSAGDLNGDGYADVIIGIPGKGIGQCYIYFGGLQMDNIEDLILTPELAGGYFGSSVSSAGDVNNDGYADVIVGASVSGTGKAYIYYGGSEVDNMEDAILTGELTGDYFGSSVSSAGDINNDGYDDVIIGAYGDNTEGEYTGKAYIYYGGLSMDDVADVILTGESLYSYFGYDVSSAGDVNNDGFSDVIIGAYYAGGQAQGKAYIFYGGSEMDNVADVVFTGKVPYGHFGCSVSSAGDVNGDGYDDVIVGKDESNSCEAYIFCGGPWMDSVEDIVLEGETAYDFFGYAVSAAGDVNKDGYGDVIVGAWNNSSVGFRMGKAYLYAGKRFSSIELESKRQIPAQYSLSQNYPNPFNPCTSIEYSVPVRSKIYIAVYDLLGKEVKCLIDQEKPAGYYHVEWNGKNNQGNPVASGIYLYQMVVKDHKGNEQFFTAKKLLLLQ